MTRWPDGYGRRVLDRVDSTNAEAARIARGLPGPEWILALEQTAARGRRGRAWASAHGNFAATLVRPAQEPPAQLSLRSFVAALALHTALAKVTGRPERFALKWPNDVLLDGGKLAGILLESAGGDRAGGVLAIGFGVNLAEAPAADALEPGAVPPVSLLSLTGVSVTPEEFLDRLAPAFADYERQLVTYGFAPVRAAWLQRAARLGEVIRARTHSEEIAGIFETVDAAGNLVLSTAGGRRAIAAAEVFF
ncbi:biotin--[acetyl-CoA-carboxylase] ligase [Roseovarius salinarum]|uniref:biotin--[acetyl-CoA-carboxylase] ligase n=1 Tax=Roseovarius salinarum TaxID=1981892 RepID=UPI000C31FDBF|nr:biotin--[acetyl-CoA-carboxylase] ligase [Roseovarius salinarum]